MRKKQIKLWGSAGLACFALMVSLGVDLSTISAEAENGGFIRWDYYGYLPEINLCVCYDRLGDTKRAYEYHLRARQHRPEAQEVRWNEEYFQKKGMDEPIETAGHMIQ